MGAPKKVRLRVVFDTITVISALLFSHGKLAWLRGHWRSGSAMPLLSEVTAAELARVLAYPKFRLSFDDRLELLADYVPYCEVVKFKGDCSIRCRDRKDQPFLDLATVGRAQVLVNGDKDLLVLAGRTTFSIEPPAAYHARYQEPEEERAL